jgi:hypothetical protein
MLPMVILKRYMFHVFVLLINLKFTTQSTLKTKQCQQCQIGRRWEILLDFVHVFIVYDDERDASSCGGEGVKTYWNQLMSSLSFTRSSICCHLLCPSMTSYVCIFFYYVMYSSMTSYVLP